MDGPRPGRLDREREAPCVVGVVGRSGTGKTSLLERLVPRLAGVGLRVAAIKHASHGFDVDRPGKDSDRLYRAGAAVVALVSPTGLVTLRPRSGPERLVEALAALPPGLDLALAEGFSWEAIPRIVLLRPGSEPVPEHLSAGPVLGVLSVPAPEPGLPPVFPSHVLDDIAETLGRLSGVLDPMRSHDCGAPEEER